MKAKQVRAQLPLLKRLECACWCPKRYDHCVDLRVQQSDLTLQLFVATEETVDSHPPAFVCHLSTAASQRPASPECTVTLRALTSQGRVALLGGAAPVARRGDLQHFADRLDPVVLVDADR